MKASVHQVHETVHQCYNTKKWYFKIFLFYLYIFLWLYSEFTALKRRQNKYKQVNHTDSLSTSSVYVITHFMVSTAISTFNRMCFVTFQLIVIIPARPPQSPQEDHIFSQNKGPFSEKVNLKGGTQIRGEPNSGPEGGGVDQILQKRAPPLHLSLNSP
jgi:hypothetical protein